MADVIRKVLEHRGKRFSKAGDLSFYLKKESRLRTFEETIASTDLILAIAVEGDDQGPEKLTSEARQAGDRMQKATIAGRIDHGEKTMRMEIRPPLVLSGASTLMGDAMLEAVFGFRRIVNSQAKVVIDSLVSHARTGTVVRITAAEEAYQLGDVVAINSRNAQSTPIHRQPACIANVAFAVGGAGTVDLTLKPALTGEPYAAGGTKDQIQGGVTWKPLEDWSQTWSALWSQGFEGDAAEGTVVPSATFNWDGRSLLTVEFALHFRKSIYSGIGFIRGAAGVDGFSTTATLLQVDDASIFKVGAFVDIVRYAVSTGLEDGHEVKARVTAIDTAASPNTVTLTRGSAPTSVTGGTQDLTAVSLLADADNIVAGITIATGDFLRVEIDARGYIDVPLTAGASRNAGHLAADINAALQYSALYGQATDAPFTDANWATTAVEDTTGGTSKLKLSSKTYGSQSVIRAINSGLAGDQFLPVWAGTTTLTWSADKEAQIRTWTPGGTETRLPIVNKSNVCRVDGYQLLLSQAAVSLDNQVEHIEDIKTGDDYEAGHLEGRIRKVEAAITVPAYGWTERLRKMAEDNAGLFLGFVTGATEGATFSVFITKGVPGTASKSGDNRQDKAFTCTGQDPAVTVTAPGTGTVYKLPDIVAGLT